MKVGLYNLEPNVENTAMMQVSQYHKQRGDEVSIYSPIFHDIYDRVYAFSIFKFTPKHMIRKGMITGGTGFDVTTKLAKDIQACDLDYTIFPKCNTSYIWFSRGCIRKCPFCVVPKKEGPIRVVKPKNLNPNGKTITVMDDNFFASPKWKDAIEQLVEWKQPMDFECGIDVRIFNGEMGHALKSLRLQKRLHIAWDNPKEDLTEKIELLKQFVPKSRIMSYVLIGFWSTPDEDLMRTEKLRELGIDPFVMPYSKKDEYQRHFARYVNHKATWKTVKWYEYNGGILKKWIRGDYGSAR